MVNKKLKLSALAISLASIFLSNQTHAEEFSYNGEGAEKLTAGPVKLKNGYLNFSKGLGIFRDSSTLGNYTTISNINNLGKDKYFSPEFIVNSYQTVDSREVSNNNLNINAGVASFSSAIVNVLADATNLTIEKNILNVSGGGEFGAGIYNVLDSTAKYFLDDIVTTLTSQAENNSTTIKDGNYIFNFDSVGSSDAIEVLGVGTSYGVIKNNLMNIENSNFEVSRNELNKRMNIIGVFTHGTSTNNLMNFKNSQTSGEFDIIGSRALVQKSNVFNIENSKIAGQIFGARSPDSNAKIEDNILNISNSEVGAKTFGTYSNRDNEYVESLRNTLNSYNSVFQDNVNAAWARGKAAKVVGNIFNDVGSEFHANVISGNADYDESIVQNNELNLVNSSSLSPSSTIAAGYSNHGDDVSFNKTNIKDSTLIGTVGSQSVNSSAHNNSTVVSGGSIEGNVFGALARVIADDNSVVMSDVAFSGNVNGGYASAGSASGNSVKITNTALTETGGNIFGGQTNVGEDKTQDFTVSRNTVDVNMVNSTGRIYGGFAGKKLSVVNADGNVVSVSNSNLSNDVAGASIIDGTTTNNVITVKDSSATSVFGGINRSSGNSINNTAIIDNATAGQVFGGYTLSDNAENNHVIVKNNSQIGKLSGGRTTGEGKAINNTVTLNSAVITGAVSGGERKSNATGDVFSGNRLNVYNSTDKSITAGSVSNFEDIYFDISHSSDASPMLNVVSDRLLFGDRDGNGKITNVHITGSKDSFDNATVLVNSKNAMNDSYRVLIDGLDVTQELPDFIEKNSVYVGLNANKTQLQSSYRLSWNAQDQSNASGTFTVNNEFNVGSVLEDKQSNAIWNGTSLTKNGDGKLTLSADNTYTGGTTINKGTLQLGNGGTSGSVLGDIVNNGTLAFNRSDVSTYGGIVSGSGALEQAGTGTTVLTGNNTYTGGTTISSGTLQLGDGGTSGSVLGDIVNNSTLVFNRGDVSTYGGIISGSGALEQAGTGTTVLTGNNTYTGETTVSSGTLQLGVSDALGSTSGVTVASGAALNLGGNSQTVTTLNNSGTVLVNDPDAGVLASLVKLYGDVINSGSVVVDNGSRHAGRTLAVEGNWTGNGGTVSLGTALGGDNSLTDKLAISGNATGTTTVAVNNKGGSGAQTLEGIEIITTGGSASDAFVQSGRIVAGSYEYHMQQGTASGQNANNWYLTSTNNGSAVGRPEQGSYASNLEAASTMFNTRLQDRLGSGTYVDPVTGETKETSLWGRSVGGHTEGHMSDGQSTYKANRFVFQLGGDVMTGSLTRDDIWHLGIMGAYGKQDSTSRNSVSGHKSKGSVWGYSTGLYGTWYQNAKDKTGLYADSWVLYNWFNNSVKGDELAYEKYNSKGLTASLESGYKFHAGSYYSEGELENRVYVTPQAQVLWSGVRADDHTEENGTQVQGRGSDNVQTRLGVRLSVAGKRYLDKGTVREFEPFVETNWIYTAKDYGVKMGDGGASIQGRRNAAEIKTGVEGRISKNLNVWGNVSQQLGAHDYRDTQGVLGLSYGF